MTFAAAAATKATMMGLGGLPGAVASSGHRAQNWPKIFGCSRPKERGYNEGSGGGLSIGLRRGCEGGLLAAYVTHNRWSKISYINQSATDNNHHHRTGSSEESLKKSSHGAQRIQEGRKDKKKRPLAGRKLTRSLVYL